MLILLVCFVAVASEDPLKAILRSPTETLRLYSDFKEQQHLSYVGQEDRLRFKMFRHSAELVAAANSEEGRTATFTLNKFSAMTRQEFQSYLGFNASGFPATTPPLRSTTALKTVPDEKLWTDDSLVTPVKDQASCGSCWTFGAVGGLETRYALISGVLRNFAEQEYLDCVYEDIRGKDGCNGGWMHHCYEYSAANGGRLAPTSDYAYTMYDRACQKDSKPNAMIAAKIDGNTPVGATEAENIAAIAEGPITVAFEATSYFSSYSSGILKDMTCTGSANHAVTAVGYTAAYILVKNSWGYDWGDRGFVRYTRNYHNCHLFKYSSYPTLTATGVAETAAADDACTYTAPDDDTPFPQPTCVDEYRRCTQAHCSDVIMAEQYCAKTCDKCVEEGECPSGTILCPDGTCMHKHMC